MSDDNQKREGFYGAGRKAVRKSEKGAVKSRPSEGALPGTGVACGAASAGEVCRLKGGGRVSEGGSAGPQGVTLGHVLEHQEGEMMGEMGETRVSIQA